MSIIKRISNKISKIKSNKGLAIVIVMVFSMALIILGSAYLKTSTNVASTINPKALEQIQANFLAKGLMKIALLKLKKLPADFYHAYIHEINRRNGRSVQLYNPNPWAVFTETSVNNGNSIFHSHSQVLQNLNNICSGYDINFNILSQRQYNIDIIEIVATFTMASGKVYSFRDVYHAQRVRIMQ